MCLTGDALKIGFLGERTGRRPRRGGAGRGCGRGRMKAATLGDS